MNLMIFVLVVAIAIRVDVHPWVVVAAAAVGLLDAAADAAGVKARRDPTT